MVAGIDVERLRRSPLLQALPRAELEQLVGLMRRRTYRRGEVVARQGDPGDSLHVVLDGHLKVVLSSEVGEDLVVTVLGPGALFGELALLDGAPRSATGVALEPLITATLHRSDFLGLVRRSPPAFEGLLAGLAATIRRKDGEATDLASLDIPGRLAKKLLQLADAHGAPAGGGTEIPLPLTQEELAAMIGATRVSVNKALAAFQDDGAITRHDRHIVVRDPALLREAAGV